MNVRKLAAVSALIGTAAFGLAACGSDSTDRNAVADAAKSSAVNMQSRINTTQLSVDKQYAAYVKEMRTPHLARLNSGEPASKTLFSSDVDKYCKANVQDTYDAMLDMAVGNQGARARQISAAMFVGCADKWDALDEIIHTNAGE